MGSETVSKWKPVTLVVTGFFMSMNCYMKIMVIIFLGGGFSIMGYFIGVLLIGAIAGVIAGQLTRGQGHGVVINILLGVVGAVIGNFTILSLFGFAAYETVEQLVASAIGAITALWGARFISPGKAKS